VSLGITEPAALTAAALRAAPRSAATIVIIVVVVPGRSATAALFPATTSRFGMSLGIAEPTALTSAALRRAPRSAAATIVVVILVVPGPAAAALFPTATSRFGMALGIAEPTALRAAALRCAPRSAASTIVVVVIVVPRTTATALIPTATGRFRMSFGIAEPTALRAAALRAAPGSAAATIVIIVFVAGSIAAAAVFPSPPRCFGVSFGITEPTALRSASTGTGAVIVIIVPIATVATTSVSARSAAVVVVLAHEPAAFIPFQRTLPSCHDCPPALDTVFFAIR
jgi:hypothetical protein